MAVPVTSPAEREHFEGTGPDCLIESAQLDCIRRVAKRLYTEDRMNGDEMRNLAHALMAIHDVCRKIEIPRRP